MPSVNKPDQPAAIPKPQAPPAKAATEPAADTQPAAAHENVAVTTASGQAQSKVSLGFDDTKPTAAPDQGARFPERGRSINVPLFSFDESGAKLVNPLPASGLSDSDNKRGGIVLEGTPSQPSRIFNSVDAPSQAVATLFDHLSHKYPNLESSVLWRLAKVGTYVAIDVPLMVAAHEMGHGAAALDNCPQCAPTVTMTNWMSGYTSYNLPEGVTFSEKEKLFSSVAGMNQATYNGEEINRRMHTEGADVKDAIGYLVNITNSMNYQLKDWIKNAPPGYNDASTYSSILESRNKGWNQENLSMLSVGVNLLNVDFWAALIGTGRYLATGKDVKLPEIKIGQAGVSFPHLSLNHTYEGPLLNASIYGHLQGPETLELKYSQILTPDNGPGVGVEARLHNWAVPGTDRQLNLGPRAGVSVHDKQIGFKTGLGIEYRPANNPYLSLTGGVDYRHNYLPDAHLPNTSGFQADAGVKVSFW